MSNVYILNGTGFTQFGKKILATQLRFASLQSNFEVDPQVQRELDPRKRSEIREFIMKAIDESEFYFSPFIFSARGKIYETDEGWRLEPGCKVYILDGQHRSAAMVSAISHLSSQMETAEEKGLLEEAERIRIKISKLKNYPVSMQIYLDLEQYEERQMFTDINTERKEAHIGLVMQYDQRDPYTELTRKIAEQLQHHFEIEEKRSRITIENSSMTSLAIMRKCLLALFEGVLTVKTGDPYFRNCKQSEIESISMAFFELWPQLFPRQMANKHQFVCGYTGIQVALAYTVYQLTKNHSITHQESIESLKILEKVCTWMHDDPLFAHIYDPSTERIKKHSSTTAIKKTALLFQNEIEKKGLANYVHK